MSVYVPFERASTEPLLGARFVNDELFNSTCRRMLSDTSHINTISTTNLQKNSLPQNKSGWGDSVLPAADECGLGLHWMHSV